MPATMQATIISSVVNMTLYCSRQPSSRAQREITACEVALDSDRLIYSAASTLDPTTATGAVASGEAAPVILVLPRRAVPRLRPRPGPLAHDWAANYLDLAPDEFLKIFRRSPFERDHSRAEFLHSRHRFRSRRRMQWSPGGAARRSRPSHRASSTAVAAHFYGKAFRPAISAAQAST